MMMMQHSYPQPIGQQQIYRTISESHALNNGNNMQLYQLSPITMTGGDPTSAAAEQQQAAAAAKFGRILSKKASRVKEIMLQNIGKADRSSDSIFQMHEQNFFKQHSQASKLYKAFRAHYKSIKSSQETGRNLGICIEELSADYQVARHDLICDGLTNLESLNDAHMDKLRQRILVDLSQFSNNFANLKDKIAKRHRKQIDYDASKRLYELALADLNKKRPSIDINNDASSHQVEQLNSTNNSQRFNMAEKVRSMFSKSASVSSGSFEVKDGTDNGAMAELETSASRLVEEARLLKLREQYNYCKIMFDTVNGELCDELPMLYECKMKQILSVLHSYFSLGAKYHSECSKLMSSSGHAIEELPFAMIARQGSRASLPEQQQSPIRMLNGRVSGEVIFAKQIGLHADENNDDGNDDDHLDKQLDEVCDSKVKHDVGGVANSGSSSSGNSSRGDSASVSGQGSLDHHLEMSGDSHDDRLHNELDVDQDVLDDVDVDDNLKKIGSCSNLSFEEDGESRSSDCVNAVDDDQSYGHCSSGAVDSSSLNVPVVSVTDENVLETFVPSSSGENIIKSDKILTKSQSIAAGRNMKFTQVTSAPPPPPASKVKDDDQLEATIASTSSTPTSISLSKFMYKVKTQFKYLAEDVDELCFEADEILQVIEFEASQEPEEGWLMGVREVNGQKGLFPANFTKPI